MSENMAGHGDARLRNARLLADIGGTNARFAWQEGANGPLQDIRTLACAEHATLEVAIQAYLDSIGRGVPSRCAMGVATPVNGDLIRMTNHHWQFSRQAVQARFGFDELAVINDFTALALAIPLLQPDELRVLRPGPTEAQAGKAMGLLGAGTGLGMGGLLPFTGPEGLRWVPIEGEGGHQSLAPGNALEIEVLQRLQARHGRVSLERVLCGPGMVGLLEAMEQIQGRHAQLPERTAAAIVAAAQSGQDALCVEVLNAFCGMLGSAAGDLALLLGARGGIYIGGGIVPRMLDWLASSSFRARFEDKGRLSTLVRDIPVFVICAEVSPALRGAGMALR
jgi:glucokinase